MKKIINWLVKKKQQTNLQDCQSFKIDLDCSDKLFGGFKEYKPPIYEHDIGIKTQVEVTDLFKF